MTEAGESLKVKSYFVPMSELNEEKQMRKRILNKKHCNTSRKRYKSFAAEPSIMGQEPGQSRDHKSQEDDHILLEYYFCHISFFGMASVSNK